MRHGSGTGGSSDLGTKASCSHANALWGTGRRRSALLLAIAVVAASVAVGAATTVKAGPSAGLAASWADMRSAS